MFYKKRHIKEPYPIYNFLKNTNNNYFKIFLYLTNLKFEFHVFKHFKRQKKQYENGEVHYEFFVHNRACFSIYFRYIIFLNCQL